MEKQFIKRIISFLIGCFIIQVGAACFINANTGGDSSVVLIQGISNILNISVGVANYIFMFVALILLLLFARDKISLGTFLAAFGSGVFLDLANIVIKNLSIESLPFIIRLLTVPVSCVIIAIGFSIQKTANLGVAPHDEIPFLIVEFTKVQYRWVRITLDVSYIVIGFLMGGVFGLGTIVATMCIGPSIQYFLPKVEKPIEKFINGNAKLISE